MFISRGSIRARYIINVNGAYIDITDIKTGKTIVRKGVGSPNWYDHDHAKIVAAIHAFEDVIMEMMETK